MTKAQKYRYLAERTGAQGKVRESRRRKSPVAGAETALQKRVSRVREASATGKPTRKSTRKSSNRSKPESNLERQQTMRLSLPGTQARKFEARRR